MRFSVESSIETFSCTACLISLRLDAVSIQEKFPRFPVRPASFRLILGYHRPPNDPEEGIMAMRKCFLQEVALQLSPHASTEDVTQSKDAGLLIMTEMLDQNLSRRPGRNARHRDTDAYTSRKSSRQVPTLMAEVQGLNQQLAAQGDQMNQILHAL
ncbi:hypothetical protein DVH24_018837 [Malus domestica]|uniref:Uncharacterized protein n=1 Tax=Malus domestica TaxID=3750 RepID=A0A498HNK6_MALDO|nr:hypothetical protein DVH24_018837 [Malus domestica]